MWFSTAIREDAYVSGNDDTTFRLDDLKGININGIIAELGHEYYDENRVRYLCLNGTDG